MGFYQPMGGYSMMPAYARWPVQPSMPYGGPMPAPGTFQASVAPPTPMGVYASAGYANRQPGMMPVTGMYPPRSLAQPGPGVVPASYTVAGPANPMLSSAQNTAQPVPQLLNMLQESLYPSQREWAADNLAGCDWRTHPHVVQALVTGAVKDPAATVRAGCV